MFHVTQSACPDEAELWRLARGTLSGERGAAVREHIGDCALCRAAVADLARQYPTERAGEDDAAGGSRYELVRLLATGGMGEVFLARDHLLGRDVAIKLLHEGSDTSATRSRSRAHLLREARALASLTHPNVVAVYDQGVLDGRSFLAMEYVRGRTLRRWIAEDRPALERITEVMLQTGRGLAAAHHLGIVHRDFKPENVLVGDDGRARVTDFGLAGREPSRQEDKASPSNDGIGDGSAAPTDQPVLASAIGGTPAYMAPEQLDGMPADARSDQHAFCVTLHEAIHGARPHPSDAPSTRPDDRRARRLDRPAPPCGGAAGGARVPAVDRAIARGLSRDPADRFPSMAALLTELEAAIAVAGPGRTRRTFALVGVGGAAVVAIVVSLALHGGSSSTTPAGFHAPCSSGSGACSAPLVCHYSAGNTCGVADLSGTCGWPNDTCDASSPEACGCDGLTYPNQCEAHKVGVSVGYRGHCVGCTLGADCPDVFVAGTRASSFCHITVHARDAGAGFCMPRPTTCGDDRDPVCGWDHRTYPNACIAHASGTDVEYKAACSSTVVAEPTPDDNTPGPGSGGLTFRAADEQGMDARPLLDLARWIQREKLPIFSLLISRHGAVVFELYTGSITREHSHYLMGATGAVTSALVGIAIDRHLVGEVDTPIADALPPEVFPSAADRERFRHVTLRDVLAMSALDAPVPPQDQSADSNARVDAFLASRNRTTFALGQRLLAEPGRAFQFTDITPQIATGILSYATKMSVLEFAEQTLFRRLDFRNYEWMGQDATGIDNGSYGLRLRPIDMQKFGVLFLQHGVWSHEQILSEAWAVRSLEPWVKSSPNKAAPDFGWYWKTIDFDARGSVRAQTAAKRRWIGHLASGWKGQRIAVFPAQDVVVTMTGVVEAPEDERALFARVVREYVIPSVDGVAGNPPHADPSLRQPLADLLARIRVERFVSWSIEPRLVPSIEPKSSHHGFRPN
jgi:CubicO group peptidase (beta-lactamase class C family)/predicted Ser/Thr protein kinase